MDLLRQLQHLFAMLQRLSRLCAQGRESGINRPASDS